MIENMLDMTISNDISNNDMKNGHDLQKYRVKNNLTQKELGDLVNYSLSRIGAIEAGNLEIPKRMLREFKKLKEKR